MVDTTPWFLCPYCASRSDSYEAMKSHVLERHKAQPLPLPEGLIRFTLNGQEYQLQVEPEWTLYYLIHDRLGLTGTKIRNALGGNLCRCGTYPQHPKAVLDAAQELGESEPRRKNIDAR